MSDLYNSVLFPTPVWDVYEPRFIKPLIKATNFYVKDAKKRNQKYIKGRDKHFKVKLQDFGLSNHSTKLYNDPRFEGLEKYINGADGHNSLDLNKRQIDRSIIDDRRKVIKQQFKSLLTRL